MASLTITGVARPQLEMLERNQKAAEQRRQRDVRDFAAARDAAAGSSPVINGAGLGDDFALDDARSVRAVGEIVQHRELFAAWISHAACA